MSIKKQAIELGRKARKNHSAVKRTRHNDKIQLRREATESEVEP